MDLNYLEWEKCRISIPSYMKDVIESFPQGMGASMTQTAADNLFKTRDDGEARKLPVE